jgi:L-ascorbate metabolism protein UlaG (beta-lactamase superfamily)
MRIKWLGHAAVEIVSRSGLRILTDPYMPGWFAPPAGTLYHKPITEPYDIIAVTHEHEDHNVVTAVPGNPAVVRGMEIKGKGIVTVKGIDFWSIGTFHDDKEGKLWGENTILCFNVDGIKVGHSGDIGHVPTKEQLDEINEYGMDILLLCIGLVEKEGERLEKYVIDTEAKIMTGIFEALKPTIKFLIPIHYRNEKCDFRFITVAEFCRGKQNVVYHYLSYANFNPRSRPGQPVPQILVLKHDL